MPSLLDEYTAPVTTNAELGDFIAWLNERWLPEIKRLAAGGEPEAEPRRHLRPRHGRRRSGRPGRVVHMRTWGPGSGFRRHRCPAPCLPVHSPPAGYPPYGGERPIWGKPIPQKCRSTSSIASTACSSPF